MIINNIEYPLTLINAVKNNKLVIFAGAGVSMASPTKLPSFNELTKQIGVLINDLKKENEADEQYLGRVENLGHNVHKDVCSILNKYDLEPNRYHETIINLFNENDIRIVTTNYDLMFERSLESNNIKAKCFSYPALPYGNDFNGIIHLHGDVNNYKHIVLTDSDFGKSYIYYGNVTNFLRELFDSEYVVLFVGYSYNDIVMKYFTRSLPDLTGEKRYIYANNHQINEFQSLGLTPIIYDEDDYDQIYDSIDRLSKLIRRDENKWNMRITDIISEFPNKMNEELNYEINEILSNIHYNNKFFDKVKGKQWAEYLFKSGYFDDIFSKNKLNDFDFKRIERMINNVIIDDLDLFIKFCYEKDFKLSSNLENEIVSIICKQKLNINEVKILINLIDFKDISFAYLKNLLEYCYTLSPELDYEAAQIFSNCLHFDLTKESLISKSKLDMKFKFSKYQISVLWEIYKKFDKMHSIDILNLIILNLKKLSKFNNINILMNDFIFYSFYEEDNDYYDEINIVMHVFSKLLLSLDDNYKKYLLTRNISSNLNILVRSSLFILRNINTYTSAEKLEFLENNNIKIFALDLKEDLFMIYSDIFPSLENKEMKLFLKKLMEEEKLSEKFDDKTYFYQKYNLLIRLDQFDPCNSDIKYYIDRILYKYTYFKPRSNPQKSIGSIITSWKDAPLPFTENDIVNDLPILFDSLLSYSGDGFVSAERSTLIKTIEEICHQNFKFRTDLINMLIESEEFDNDLWKSVILSLVNTDNLENSFIKNLNNIFIESVIEKHAFELSSVIYLFIKEQEKLSEEMINNLYEKNLHLWPYASNYEYVTEDYITRALNSSKGNIAFSTINIINLTIKNLESKTLNNNLKSFMETMLCEEYNDALIVILGNVSFLYSLDKKWCINNILNKYNSEKKQIFNIAREGFSYLSTLYFELELEMIPIFHQAIKNLHIIENAKIIKNMINIYISLMLRVSDDPICEYIPNIFSLGVSSNIISIFYFELGRYIESLNESGRNEIFEKWVLQFLDNRINSFPIEISDYEKNLILQFMLNFPNSTGKLQNIFKDLKSEFVVDLKILYEILSSIEIKIDNSQIVCEVLIILTYQIGLDTQNELPGYLQEELKEIYQELNAINFVNNELFTNFKKINLIT